MINRNPVLKLFIMLIFSYNCLIDFEYIAIRTEFIATLEIISAKNMLKQDLCVSGDSGDFE